MAVEWVVDGPGPVSAMTLRTGSWPAEAAHLREIRTGTRRWLTAAGLRAPVLDDVVLAVSEAVSNAIEHAYAGVAAGTVELTVVSDAHTLCVDVADHGSWRATRPDDDTRFGLTIMRVVMDAVSVRCTRSGTRVRLQCARRG